MELQEAIVKIKELISWKGSHIEIRDYEIEAIETLLNHLTKQEKMIDKMADEILELNTMIVEKEELFSVVPMWLGKEHIIEYFKGITNKKD